MLERLVSQTPTSANRAPVRTPISANQASGGAAACSVVQISANGTISLVIPNDKISGEFTSPLDFMVMPFGHS